MDRRQAPGRYSLTWDGTNGLGKAVADGLYFYTMEGGPFKATRKVLLLR
jgi:hypothetical protein